MQLCHGDSSSQPGLVMYSQMTVGSPFSLSVLMAYLYPAAEALFEGCHCKRAKGIT